MGASVRKGPKRGRTAVKDPGAVAVQADLEAQIIARYAAVDDNGKIRRCGVRPGEDPEERWRWAGNDGKAILRDQVAADDCARQLAVARGKRVHSYVCPRSASGHFHVSGGVAGRPGSRGRNAT